MVRNNVPKVLSYYEQVLTTFTSYGHVDRFRQGNIMKKLADTSKNTETTLSDIKQLIEKSLFSKNKNIQSCVMLW